MEASTVASGRGVDVPLFCNGVVVIVVVVVATEAHASSILVALSFQLERFSGTSESRFLYAGEVAASREGSAICTPSLT